MNKPITGIDYASNSDKAAIVCLVSNFESRTILLDSTIIKEWNTDETP